MKSLLLAVALLLTVNLYAQPDVDSLRRRIDTLEQALKEKNYMRVPVGDLDKTLEIHVQSQMLKYLGILAVLLITGTFSIFKILQRNVAEEVKGKYATLENQMNEFNKNLKTAMNELYEDLKDKSTEIRDTFKEQLSEFKDTHKRENDRQDVTIKTVTDSVVSMRSRQESFLAEVSKDVEQKISEATRIIWNDIADNKIRTVKDLGFKGSSLAKELSEFLDNPSVKLSTDKKKQLVDALMRCFYYSDNKDLKEQGFDTNYNEMAKLLKKYDVLELLPETYATAAIAFNNIYEQHHMPEDKKFCLDCCDKSLNKNKDYGEAFAVKLEVYAIDHVKAFDNAEKQKSKEELKRIFHEIKVSRSNYLHIDTLSRLYIDRNVKNLKVYIDELEKICSDEMLYMKEKACINIVSNAGEMKRDESKNLFFKLLTESSNANKNMNGTWKARKSFKAGEEISADKLNIEISINQYASFTLTEGTQSDSGYIQFLPYSNVNAVNLYLLNENNEFLQTAYCISSIEADGAWKLCSNYNHDSRPEEFSSTVENGYYLDELVKV